MPDFDDDLKLARAAIQIAGDEIPIGDREQRIALLFAITRHEGCMRALEALKTEQLLVLRAPLSRGTEGDKQTTDLLPTLKPCPICGEPVKLDKHFREDMWRLTHQCSAVGPTTPDSIAKGWNRRA